MTARHQSDHGASTEAQISGSERNDTGAIAYGRSDLGHCPDAHAYLDDRALELLNRHGLVVVHAIGSAEPRSADVVADDTEMPAVDDLPLTEHEIPNRWKPPAETVAEVIASARELLAGAHVKRVDPITGDVVTIPPIRRPK